MGTDMILTLIINIFITAFAYLIVPVLYVLRGDYISKEKRRKIIFTNGLIVFTFFSIIHIESGSDDIANVSPAILWSSIGWFMLTKKSSTPPIQEDIEATTNNTVVEHYFPLNEIEQPTQDKQNNTPVFNESTEILKQTTTKSNSWLTIALILIAIALLVGNMVQYNIILDQKETITGLKDDLSSNISFYEDRIFENAEKIAFYDSSIVFVIDGYGNYYYTYDEMMQVTQGVDFSFWAYNLEQAKSLGYKAWK